MSETKLNNMEEFEIVNEKIETIDPLDTLVNHDFSSKDEINLDESYEMIEILENEAKSITKEKEAQTIIDELSEKYIVKEYHEKMEKSIKSVRDFIKKYNVELDDVKNLTEEEKDKVFGICSFLLKNVASILNEINFTINFTMSEYKLMSTALRGKLRYDGNEVFNMIELNNRYLKPWKKYVDSLPKNTKEFSLNIDIKNVVMLYHFLGKHSVKGLSDEFYHFSTLLEKIADTNKLFNAYSVLKERLDQDFNIWNGAFSDFKEEIVEPTNDSTKN